MGSRDTLDAGLDHFYSPSMEMGFSPLNNCPNDHYIWLP